MEAVRGCFRFQWYETCMNQVSYCYSVGIGQQVIEYLLRVVGDGGGGSTCPPSFG